MVRIFTIQLLVSLLILVACLPSRAQDSSILTVGEVYDFQIGDVFHYKYSKLRNSEDDYKQKLKILDKQYKGPNQDTLVYRILQEKLNHTGKFKDNAPVYQSSIDTITRQYNQLSSPILKDINPYEDDSLSPVKRLDTLWGKYLCSQAINGYELVWTPSNNYERTIKQKWGKGLGLLLRMKSDNDRGRGSSRTKQLVFYNKQNGDSCGDRVEIENKKSGKNSYGSSAIVKVYPNPTSSEMNLLFRNDSINKRHIKIYDRTGQPILIKKCPKNAVNLDISHISPGFYWLKTHANGKIITKKLIVTD